MNKAAPFAFATAAIAVAPALAQVPKAAETIRTEAGNIEVTEVANGLVHPWGAAFLPDGRMLVTERPGRLRLITAEGELLEEPVEGTPTVWAQGQGGLLDVVVDPNFAENQLVWLSYAEPGEGGEAGTTLGRGRLADGRLEDFQAVWHQTPKVEGPNHFGNRIVFADDDTIFVTLGERFKFEPAQDLSTTLGKVIRITREGEAVEGNPFAGQEDAENEIFSYGHRNIEAAAIDPSTGGLVVAEMGPLGGDELNLIEAGANYGWPVVSWGTDYDGGEIPDPPTHPEFEDAAHVWTPVISPSGMIFYQGDLFPDFQGDAMIGGLSSEGITRIEIQDGAVAEQDHIPLGERIREVEEGPDGSIYVLTDQENGSVWKLQPLTPPE